MKTIECVLKPGKEKPLRGRHPWIFSGAIDLVSDDAAPGDLVRVFSSSREFLGTGYFNAQSQITVRMLRFDEGAVDESFFESRLRRAIDWRRTSGILSQETNACRLVHAEGDFLPGLIVDRYGDYLGVQILTAGMENWREALAGLLMKLTGCRGIYEKGDVDSRHKEGLERRSGPLAGAEPPETVEILENGRRFLVDLHEGQKTGFFLDQRDNRALLAGYSRGRRVLNCFSYTGGFSVYAAQAGASRVVSVEISQTAQQLAEKNFDVNGLKGDYAFEKRDVFDYLRETSELFELIILDPPAFCKHPQQVMQASRGYKDINLCAFKKLVPGGLIFTASCSSFIPADLFQKILFAAAKDAGREIQIVAKTSHAPDHPVSLYHPEGEYLKGFLLRVL